MSHLQLGTQGSMSIVFISSAPAICAMVWSMDTTTSSCLISCDNSNKSDYSAISFTKSGLLSLLISLSKQIIF